MIDATALYEAALSLARLDAASAQRRLWDALCPSPRAELRLHVEGWRESPADKALVEAYLASLKGEAADSLAQRLLPLLPAAARAPLSPELRRSAPTWSMRLAVWRRWGADSPLTRLFEGALAGLSRPPASELAPEELAKAAPRPARVAASLLAESPEGPRAVQLAEWSAIELGVRWLTGAEAGLGLLSGQPLLALSRAEPHSPALRLRRRSDELLLPIRAVTLPAPGGQA